MNNILTNFNLYCLLLNLFQLSFNFLKYKNILLLDYNSLNALNIKAILQCTIKVESKCLVLL